MEKVTEIFCLQVALKFVKRNSVSEYKKVSKCHNHNNNKKATKTGFLIFRVFSKDRKFCFILKL